jgi:hypothetical protein
MLVESKSLCWWGIDMRSRGRRRVAVVVTYVVMFSAGVVMTGCLGAHAWWAMGALLAEIIAIMRFTVFRQNGIVKRFEDRSFVRIRGMGEMVPVNGLDEWAQYNYGVANFEAASDAQKDELLSRFKMGTWLFPKKHENNAGTPWLDEREMKERDSAERWTLKAVTSVLSIYAGIYIAHAAQHRIIAPLDVAVEFWMFAVLMMTLPKARVLWTESEPGELSGEMALVESVEG